MRNIMTADKKTLSSLAICAALLVAGCAESTFSRSDALTPFAPNTQRTNIALQTINPLPNRAYDRRISHSGQRMAGAVQRVATGQDTEDAASEEDESLIQEGISTD